MALKGMVGAVYESDTAPISDNIALLFDWTFDVDIKKEITFGASGPELHGIPTDWHVTAEAYWAAKKIPKGQAFVRLFIGKGKDMRYLTGQVELPAMKQTNEIEESAITLEGVGLLR